jgi:hypothetical protein
MNRLADQTSPYLRQHAGNPVDWYPWGEEAFASARDRDVPVMLSIGYSACHWCHVIGSYAHSAGESTNMLREQAFSVPDRPGMCRTVSPIPAPNLSNSSVCASGNPVDGRYRPPTRGAPGVLG